MSSQAITKTTSSRFLVQLNNSITIEDLKIFAAKKKSHIAFLKRFRKADASSSKEHLAIFYMAYNLTSTNYYCLVSGIY